ncbi:MAG TPA: UDP-3-O-(3-hydroxymyristoyl)glucosamine N-acyltransferase [bacterium]|nr:UDP-3-O-(3-hydroxymyristoyl)glucosamine N-acyltransferase [bacterium]
MIELGEFAEKISGALEGDPGVQVHSVCSLDDIKEGCVVYIEKERDSVLLESRKPAAVICDEKTIIEGQNIIRTENPKLAFAKALEIFFPPEPVVAGIHESAVVAADAVVDPGAQVGPNCTVDSGAVIGSGTILRANVFVGKNAVVGSDCVLNPNVSVLDACEIGDRVILHSGVVIGADGFGYVLDGGKHRKVPQTGKVIIGPDVEIGANSTVDRATLGETVVGGGTKIDNLVQVGHNDRIGRNCILCGCVGLSGSCELGDGVVLAGQVGVSDHVKIGSGAIVGGKAGVISDIPEGKFYSGFPARPHRETIKTYSFLKKIPELMERLEAIEKQFGGE